jgi:hypothetical protein
MPIVSAVLIVDMRAINSASRRWSHRPLALMDG